MRILVTGGAGYIGGTVAQLLVEAGHEVVVYDNLSHGHRWAVPAGARFVEGDIADQQKLETIFSAEVFDGVMHFAALIEAGESMKVPEEFFRNNTAGTLTLLRAMLAVGVTKLVFSSTAAVYGEPEVKDGEAFAGPILESAKLLPTNAYGESKLLSETMMTWMERVHGMRIARLRYFNVAGALDAERGEAHEPESHLIPLVLEAAAGKRAAIKIFGTDYPTKDGTCVRDYIHVRDLAEAHLLALGALSGRGGLVYNLGNGQGFTVREVIDAVRRVTGLEVNVVEEARRGGDPAVLVASAEKIRSELGWVPKISELDEIIRSAWVWQQKRKD